MFCVGCGRKLSDDWQHCPSCGAARTLPAAPATVSAAASTASPGGAPFPHLPPPPAYSGIPVSSPTSERLRVVERQETTQPAWVWPTLAGLFAATGLLHVAALFPAYYVGDDFAMADETQLIWFNLIPAFAFLAVAAVLLFTALRLPAAAFGAGTGAVWFWEYISNFAFVNEAGIDGGLGFKLGVGAFLVGVAATVVAWVVVIRSWRTPPKANWWWAGAGFGVAVVLLVGLLSDWVGKSLDQPRDSGGRVFDEDVCCSVYDVDSWQRFGLIAGAVAVVVVITVAMLWRNRTVAAALASGAVVAVVAHVAYSVVDLATGLEADDWGLAESRLDSSLYEFREWAAPGLWVTIVALLAVGALAVARANRRDASD